jgi:hypothetical protein
MTLYNGKKLASFEVKNVRLETQHRVIFDIGVAHSEEVNRVSRELMSWFGYRKSPLTEIEKLNLSSGDSFVKCSDGTYELINRHEVYRTKEVIRRAAFVSHQRNAILAFGYRAGGVGPEHRHHVNVLKTDEKGFLGCKHNRIRSYLWAHVTWASTSLDPEIVSEEWAIVAVITPSRRGASVTFTASEIGSAGALDLSTTDDVKTSGLLSSLFGGSKRG